MYKVLLVDDEKIIREGIASLIDWKKYGFVLAGTAKNGMEACEKIEEDTPHIVITDIKMPVLNGLKLIARQSELHPGIVFVVLSGYGEFEFANRAMKYGVKHYLLKPCNENKIIEVLEDVKKELEQTERRNEYIRRNRQNLEKVLPLVREQFLRDFIMNRAYTSNEMEYYTKLLKIEDGKMRLILFQPAGEYTFEEILALGSGINEQAGNGAVYFNTVLKNQVLVLMKDFNDEKISELIKEVKESFSYYNKKEINVSYSDAVFFKDTPRAYKEAQECLKYSFYLGEGSVITKRDIEYDTEKRLNDSLVFDYERIALAVKSGNMDDVSNEIDSFFSELESSESTINTAKTYCIELFLAVIRHCSADDIDMYLVRTAELQATDSIESMHDFIRETVINLAKRNYDGIVKRHGKLVNNIIKHIYKNIDNEELTLKWLASDVLFMNVGYLGKLFNKETGEKFSYYVMKVRMEKAKELIDTCEDDRVYEVAQKVGLGDNPRYFSQVFKKYTGYTPSEYKGRKILSCK